MKLSEYIDKKIKKDRKKLHSHPDAYSQGAHHLLGKITAFEEIKAALESGEIE